MGTISRQYSFVAGAVPSAANWNADPNNFITLVNGQIDEANVDYSSADGIATLQNTQTLSGAKTFSSSSGTAFNYGVTINEGSNDSDTRIETNNMTHAVVVDAGLDAISFGAAAVDDSFVQIAKGASTSTATQNTYHLSVAPGGATTIPSGTTAYVGSVNIAEPNITATGTVTNAFTVRIAGAPTEGSTTNYALWVDAGATQLDGALSVGVDGTGADVTFYGDTSGKQALWDQSEDTLQLNDNTNLTFGTGADADIFYDGTDLNISPAVVGSGDIVVNGASIEFADSEGVTLGTGKDATIQYDGSNLVISPAAVGSGDVSISGGGIKLADSESLTLGTGSDATVTFDATNTVLATAGSFVLQTNGTTEHVRVDTGGTLYLNDDANGKMTQGITINQAANDNNAIDLKSSDVNHGRTGHAETDTYFSLAKYDGNKGGILQYVMMDNEAQAPNYDIRVTGGQAVTNAAASNCIGLVTFRIAQHNGSNSASSMTAGGFPFVVRCHDADDTDSAVFAVDEDGDLYAGNTNDSIAMSDDKNDPALLRGFDHAVDELGLAKGMIKNRWDDFVKTRDADLVELGVLGDTVENGGLYCVTQHTRLMNSAIWQVYSMLLDVIDSLPRETQDKIRKVVPNQLLLEVA